jgi:hypothetical protein
MNLNTMINAEPPAPENSSHRAVIVHQRTVQLAEQFRSVILALTSRWRDAAGDMMSNDPDPEGESAIGQLLDDADDLEIWFGLVATTGPGVFAFHTMYSRFPRWDEMPVPRFGERPTEEPNIEDVRTACCGAPLYPTTMYVYASEHAGLLHIGSCPK